MALQDRPERVTLREALVAFGVPVEGAEVLIDLTDSEGNDVDYMPITNRFDMAFHMERSGWNNRFGERHG